MKNFLIYLMIAVIFFFLGFAWVLVQPEKPPEIIVEVQKETIYLDSLENIELEIADPRSDDDYIQIINRLEARLIDAQSLQQNLKSLGYGESHPTWEFAEKEIEKYEKAYGLYSKAKKQYDEEQRWAKKEKQYPVATQIWKYMKSLGWSNEVCAGIMGNMMSEVGGKTLNLDPHLYYKDTYYGICQWSKKYYPSIWGKSLEAQCDFLRDTIEKELNTYGKLYASGMNYKKFLQMKDSSEAALCFAKAYERCSSAGYAARQNNAKIAYNYFTS